MLNNFTLFLKPQEKLSTKWVLLILFLFPIAGPVIRHWNSLLFVLIIFTSLYFLFTKKDRKPLYKEEKIYLWTFALFFLIFIISSLTNEYSWKMIQKQGLGTEINFLLFIPIYLLIREYEFAKNALLGGILLSIPVIFFFSLYEYIYILNFSKHIALSGSYSQLFIGPIAALSLLMLYPASKTLFKNSKHYFIIPIYVAMGIFIIALSQARIAYITLVIGALFLLFFSTIDLKKKFGGVVLIILIAISGFQIDIVKNRTNTAFNNIVNYFNPIGDVNKVTSTSTGLRLEVWRSSQYTFKERPLVGIGNGNYPSFIKKYIDKNLVGDYVTQMGHAHNTFIEALITKGSIGLILLLLIFYYPVYISWKNRKESYATFMTISTFSTAITLMSLGEAMLINKNNGVSYLLVFSAVLFSSMIRETKLKT